MNPIGEHLAVVRGGGDLGTGAAWRLRRVGFPVIVLELVRPLTIRRTVAFSSAVADRSIEIEGIEGVRVDDPVAALSVAIDGRVAVLVADVLPEFPKRPSVVVDARMAKQALDSTVDLAPFVVGIGPGFLAGRDCHAVVETKRGHDLGRVWWEGSAAPDSGIPGELGGATSDRVVRAVRDGSVAWSVTFGDVVSAGDQIGTVDGDAVVAGVGGVIRGLIAPGKVWSGLKIADVDPRADASAVHTISDKALAVGGGVLEAVFTWLDRTAP